MSRLTSCDEHLKWRKGCAPCNDKARRYTKGRRLAAIRGAKYSGPVDVCADWLRQLRALGFSKAWLANEIGISEKTIYQLTHGQRSFVTLGTFQRVHATYSRLCDSAPLRLDVRTTRHAEAHGWTAPHALPTPPRISEDEIDEEVVRRAVGGERMALTRAESAAAWQQLEKMGLSAREISRRLHTTQKTVERWRSGESRASSTLARRPRSA